MKLVRYLKDIELVKSVSEKQNNGTYKKSFNHIGNYRIQKKSLDDEVNASIYGANISKMWDISTPLGDLERYLIPKVDNKEDNISLYFIILDNMRYKINSVKEHSIKVERVDGKPQGSNPSI